MKMMKTIFFSCMFLHTVSFALENGHNTKGFYSVVSILGGTGTYLPNNSENLLLTDERDTEDAGQVRKKSQVVLTAAHVIREFFIEKTR